MALPLLGDSHSYTMTTIGQWMIGAVSSGKESKERVIQALERSAQSVFAPPKPIQKPWEVGVIRSG